MIHIGSRTLLLTACFLTSAHMLLADNSAHVSRATDIAEAHSVLQKLRTHTLQLAASTRSSHGTSSLPADFESTRDRMIKPAALSVLSATPLSQPSQHAQDVATLQTKLAEYAAYLQSLLHKITPEPAPSSIIPALEKETSEPAETFARIPEQSVDE